MHSDDARPTVGAAEGRVFGIADVDDGQLVLVLLGLLDHGGGNRLGFGVDDDVVDEDEDGDEDEDRDPSYEEDGGQGEAVVGTDVGAAEVLAAASDLVVVFGFAKEFVAIDVACDRRHLRHFQFWSFANFEKN